jgi:predicted O-methyltransferase YrrM
MKTDPFAVIGDARAESVLRRLHAEADRQNARVVLHHLPKLPALLLRRRVHFDEQQIRGFYADKYIALQAQQAAFCHLVVRSLRARHVVEFGTSFGVSTIWLAAAVRANGGGRVIGTELVPAKAELAQRHIEEAGLADIVEIRIGDASQTLHDLPSEPVEVLLNDGFPMLATEILQLVAPRMPPGAVVLTDNVGTFSANYRDYLAYLRAPESGFATMTVPFRSSDTEYSVRLATA